MTLWTNYFEMLPDKAQDFYRYEAIITQEGVGDPPVGKKRARIIQLLLKELPPTVPVASDFATTILTATSLGFLERTYLDLYHDEDDTPISRRSQQRYRVLVRHISTVTFADLIDFLASTNLFSEGGAMKDQLIQTANIILGHGMKSSSGVLTRRNNYYPVSLAPNMVEHWMLRHGLEAFRGFFMSVRAATGRILLNVQVQHIVVWQTLPLTALMSKLMSEHMPLADIHGVIAGLWVQLNHRGGKLRRISGLASPSDARHQAHPPRVPALGASATQTSFWKDNDTTPEYVSVATYFRQTYRALREPNLPVVNVGTRPDPVYLPMEVCTVRSMQEYTKKLKPEATADMIKFAVRRAPQNAQTISRRGVDVLRELSEPRMNQFGLRLNHSMITVSGRVLPPVNVLYAGKSFSTRDASWNMREVRFTRGASLPQWSYLWIKLPRSGNAFASMDDVTAAVARFHLMMQKCGIRAPPPIPGREMTLVNPQEPDAEVDRLFATIKNIKLLLVILPSTGATLYNAIKRAGDIKYGIHTVDVVAEGRKFAKMGDNSQYFANVSLKFNLKFGGQNQLLQQSDVGFVAQGKTMLVGLDVTHPDLGSVTGAPSVSSITASVDANLAQWPATVAVQQGRQEMVAALKEMMSSRLQLWQKHNSGRLPDEILVYRDGVGETMYERVCSIEVPLIKSACADLYPAAVTKQGKPHLTVVICGKRIKTRFYPTSEMEQDERTGGTKSGTVVDRGITETRLWDFYLQAHTALQGTPRPAHYVVVYDEIFRRRAEMQTRRDGASAGQVAVDQLESLTHALCYMYGRATKAVSLCPPAYYADLACERARRWLSGVFDGRTGSSGDGGSVDAKDVVVHANLRDSMFYI